MDHVAVLALEALDGTLGIRDGSASWEGRKRLGLFEKKVDCAFLSW